MDELAPLLGIFQVPNSVTPERWRVTISIHNRLFIIRGCPAGDRSYDVGAMNYYTLDIAILDRKAKVTESQRTPGSELVNRNMTS